MANVLHLAQIGQRGVARVDARELSRQLDLIEDRPDSVLTWADVARHARFVWRRLGPAAR
jgi:hypothetical protein